MTTASTIRPAVAVRPAPGGRIALWDNARALLIGLVVFGHGLESMRGSTSVDVVYAVVYAFHVPAFLLVSGWFARADRLDAKALLGTARLLVTWLLAEAGWVVLRLATGEPPFPGSFLVVPSWTLWFLVTLFLMRLLLPYLARLRAPLVLAVVATLGVGLLDVGTAFSASRTICLLPFFLLGWWLRGRGLDRAAWFLAPSVRVRAAAGAAMVVAAGAIVLLMQQDAWTTQLLFWRRGYAGMDLGAVEGVALRGTVLVVAAVMTLALLVLVPRTRFRWSSIGQHTLTVYLLHGPVIELLRRTPLDDAVPSGPLALLLAALLAVVLVVGLGNDLVGRLLKPLTEPDWALRRLSPS